MLSFLPRDVLDEILNLIESVSEEFPSYSFVLSHYKKMFTHHMKIYSNDIILHGVIMRRKKCII